ncbi:MAG: hypothetical protein GXO88_01840 [Chlorobi bacterium]|nr:hypothetical protein [Chlorobiota bacterium]
MMKTRTLLILVAIFATFAISSCKKSTDNGDPVTGNGSISLTYDGNNWNASLSVQAVNTNGIINVTGSDSDARQASVILMGVTAPGTYETTATSGNSLRWTEGLDPAQTYSANGILGSGSITVSEISATKIKGSFSFTGLNTNGESKNITNGAFEASF